MADNQPPSSQSQSRNILGLPIWAWGIGLGAFLIGVIYFFRQSQTQTNAQAQPVSGQNPPMPYPYPNGVTSGPAPSNQYQITLVDKSAFSGQPFLPGFVTASDNAGSVQLPGGSTWPTTGDLVPGGQYGGFWPITGPGGQKLYVHGLDVATVTPSNAQVNSLYNSQTPPGIYGYG